MRDKCSKKYWRQEIARNTTKGFVNIECYPKTVFSMPGLSDGKVLTA